MRISTNLAKFCALFFLCISQLLPAQDLPTLKTASEVTAGALPNGITYYLVTNKTDKGMADFAIIQKGDEAADSARGALVDLPYFDGKKPYRFLASNGVGYRNYGFVESAPDATKYRFEGVPVSSQAVCDTTLMMMFGISERSPYSQAVVVSGDIDPKALVERMKVLSMMVSRRQPLPKQSPVPSLLADSMRVECVPAEKEGVATITVAFASPRAPKELMNTVQPLVTEMFAKELGIIAQNRIESTFRSRLIPVAEVSTEYRSSADGPSDEVFYVSICTLPSRVQDAVQALSEVLSSLDAKSTSVEEYAFARDEFLTSIAKTAAKKTSNKEWMDRCIAAYLYGAPLATTSTRAEFFAQQRLPVEKVLPLFNDFVSALLEPSKNVALCCAAPAYCADAAELRTVFNVAWRMANVEGSIPNFIQNYGDSTKLATPKAKVKLKKEMAEPISGGKMWTFSNGMSVIYKKADTKGKFDYALMIKGGYSGVQGISQGECGFVQDMLPLYNVAGLSGATFQNMLKANAVVQNTSVSLSDMRISGSAPSDMLPFVMKSLLAVANERKVNKEAFRYYKQCEELRLKIVKREQEGIESVVDSIMCPDYKYSPRKRFASLRDDLPQRADKFFDNQFSRVGDGVIVLIGDLDEDDAKKVLCRYLGGFETSSQHAVRPSVSYKLRSGWSTCTVGSEDVQAGSAEPSINVAMSTVLPFSGERYMAYKLAQMVLEREIVQAIADSGLYLELSDSYEVFPVERLDLRISCRPAELSGLPAGITPENSLKALGRVREAIAKVSKGTLTDAQLKIAKADLLDDITAEYARPSIMMRNVLTRYSYGKDMVSGYKDKINSVTVSDVRDILKKFEEGSKVEFIVY